jgi:hypothetical protein
MKQNPVCLQDAQVCMLSSNPDPTLSMFVDFPISAVTSSSKPPIWNSSVWIIILFTVRSGV